MRYADPLVAATLVRRYKRFLADVRLADGSEATVHVPNSGAMTGCAEPGYPCFVSPAHSPRRSLPWTLEQVIAAGIPVGVNTNRANRLAEEALQSGVVTVPGLSSPWSARREVSAGGGSRIDLLLEDRDGGVWVEVKNVTWAEDGTARFPDAATRRGARHLDVLAGRVGRGERAAILYVVQRGDATVVDVARDVDPAYAGAFSLATAAGVRALAVQVVVSPTRLHPWRQLPVLTEPATPASRG